MTEAGDGLRKEDGGVLMEMGWSERARRCKIEECVLWGRLASRMTHGHVIDGSVVMSAVLGVYRVSRDIITTTMNKDDNPQLSAQ